MTTPVIIYNAVLKRHVAYEPPLMVCGNCPHELGEHVDEDAGDCTVEACYCLGFVDEEPEDDGDWRYDLAREERL